MKTSSLMLLSGALGIMLSSAVNGLPFPEELLMEEANLPNPIPGGEDVAWDAAINGNRAVSTLENRADLFVRENNHWRYQGSLTGPPNTAAILSTALEGDTLVLGDGRWNMEKGTAYVYARGTEPGRNAWNITSKGRAINYSVDLDPSQHQSARNNGWRYQFDVRFLDSYYPDWPLEQPSTMLFAYGNGTTRYGVYLRVNADGDLVARLMGATPADHVLTTNGAGATDYRRHELVFDPGSAEVTYSFNGQPVHTWQGENSTINGILWGSLGSYDASGSMNVHHARFEILQTTEVPALYNAGMEGNPVVAPDPAGQGWTLELSPAYGDPPPSVAPQSPDPATVWQLQATLTGDSAVRDSFGSSLALSGDTLVVGAPRESAGGTNAGAAYVFIRQGSTWERQQKLTPSVLDARDQYGLAVDIDGETILVGAPHPDASVSHTFPGRAFVFVRDGVAWTQQTMLTSEDGKAKDAFGAAVAVDGDRAAVGAHLVSQPGPNYLDPITFAGAAYIFERSGVLWSEVASLAPDPAVGYGEFGSTLDLHGDTLLVGAERTPAFYLFTRSPDESWDLGYRLVYPFGHPHSIGKVAFDETGERFITGLFAWGDGSPSSAAFIYHMDFSNPANLAGYVRRILYYPDALAANVISGFKADDAAFRYKHLLYQKDTDGVSARHDEINNHYGQVERDLVQQVEAKLIKGLAHDPNNPDLGNLILDIHYDRTQVEAILARNLLVEAEKARIGPPVAPPSPTGGFLIDNEIDILREALDQSELALQGYFSLLIDDLGVSGDPPLGFRIFHDLVPTRGLMEATYVNGNEILPVTTGNAGAAQLFPGFKDLSLLFNLLRDHARSAQQLGWLLMARNNEPGDIEETNNLLAHSERSLFLQGNLLQNIFPSLPEQGDPSGLAEAVQGWSTSLESLADLRQMIIGQVNPIGFAPDFLMLIENFHGLDSSIFDSFDVFKKHLDPNDSVSSLARALDKLDEARTNYAEYRGYEDQLGQQFSQSTISYEYRLLEIVGAVPGDANYSDVPDTNPGSELDQQFNSLKKARLRIIGNRLEIDNLIRETQIEINRAADVRDVVIRHGDHQASLCHQIGLIEADQAAYEGLANSINFSDGPYAMFGYLAMGAVNTSAQFQAEREKGRLQAEQERLAAVQHATIEGIDSAARVKTLLLGMRTLLVDSSEAALLFRQEVGRMTALYREKAALETRLAEAQASMTTRYFADPVHRLAAGASLVEANLRFEAAQRWLFFMVRALEYKWNTPFANYLHDGHTWSANTLFKLRNADELEAFHAAMIDYDALINRGTTPREDWFSVRRDFMGLRDFDDLGEPAEYIDPETGQAHDALGMFRILLGRKTRAIQNGSEIVLEFNTVRQIPGGFFFVGPTFNTDGTIHDKGRSLDKINYLKIRLPGSHTLGRSQLAGNLTYGGTSFIRNFNVGHLDPERPDRLVDEMTAYSTRYWFYDPTQQRWKFTEGLKIDAVAMELTGDERVEPTVSEILEFKERSVAATGWKLAIPLVRQGTEVLKLNELNDIEIYFNHYSAARH